MIDAMEQVFLFRSESYRKSPLDGLEGRSQRVTAKLMALPLHPTRGLSQIQDEVGLVNEATASKNQEQLKGIIIYLPKEDIINQSSGRLHKINLTIGHYPDCIVPFGTAQIAL